MAVIQASIWREWMNPLGLDPARFLVAVRRRELVKGQPYTGQQDVADSPAQDDREEVLGFGQLQLQVDSPAPPVQLAAGSQTSSTGARDGSGSRAAGPGQTVTKSGKEWELRSLVVLPHARGTGVGSQLVRGLQAQAGVGDRVVLVTLASTVPFYQAQGFRVVPHGELPSSVEWEVRIGSVVARLATAGKDALVAMDWYRQP